MTKSIQFCIVTPVLNGAEFVYRFVQCLQAQVYCDWHAYIIDDGSNDATLELFRDLTRDDPRFHLYCNESTKSISGPYQARNYGLNQVDGDYVCFLDIDDYWHPHRLLHLSHLINNSTPTPKLIYSSYYRVNRANTIISKRFSRWYLPPKLLISFVNIVPMLTSCISVSFLRSSRILFLPHHHEDYIFWRSVILSVPSSTILVDDHPLSYYLVSSNSLSGNKFRSLLWLANCYDHFGYNIFQKIAAFVCRFIFEIFGLVRSHLTRLFGSTF